MKHYRFIHFLWFPSKTFCTRVVKMINNPEYGFSSEDHLFVTPHKDLYANLSSFLNVVLFETNRPFDAKMINSFAPYGNWLIIHSIPYWQKAFFIKRKYQKKIVWRTWGSDSVLFNTKKGNILVRNLKIFLNIIRKKMVHRFYAVGLSSSYIDYIDITRNYGELKTFELPYADKDISFSEDQLSHESHSSLNILVGHSGTPLDNHINVLNFLKRFKGEDFRIYLLLSYGNSDYIKKIIQYVKDYWPDKIEIITEYMTLNQFNVFCSKMDICIFDGLQSYAIGNISTLATMRKKLVFNRNGLWHQAFSDKGFPHMCTDELESCSFEELKENLVFEKEYYEGIDNKPFEEKIEGWKAMFSELSSKSLK